MTTKQRSNLKFSILIPSWNNIEYLKLCIESIRKNSVCEHQILVYANEGSDGTLEWLKTNNIEHIHSPENVGVCFSLNALRSLVKTNYIVFMNDDMYVCPNWDTELMNEINNISHNMFFLSSTLIQPRKFWCKSVIAPADYGQNVADFDEQRLLAEYNTLPHYDWSGSTWPPNIVHRDIWDLVGGYSIELSPGMYSDPDFSAKLWKAGVRIFKGINASRVYHFEAVSTKRVKKNDGSKQFLYKWGITSSTFMRDILHRGEMYQGPLTTPIVKGQLKTDILRSKLKKIIKSFSNPGQQHNLWN